VSDGECGIVVRQPSANRNLFVEPPRQAANASGYPGDGRGRRVQFMREIDFGEGFLIEAADQLPHASEPGYPAKSL
jgi:hypothetical protein